MPGAVTILGHRLWQQWFGGDRNVLGRVVRVDDLPLTVIGVLPPTEQWLDTELLVPFQPIVTDFRSRRMLSVIGRLRAGVTSQRAAEALQKTATLLSEEFPETHAGWTVTIRPYVDLVIGAGARRTLQFVGVAGVVLLLIACANFANLLLARAVGRRRELAVQTALGAGRLRLARRLLTESLMLAVLGGGLGLLFSLWCVDLFRAFGAGEIPRVDATVLGWQALAFGAAVALASGLLTGLIPALYVSGGNLRDNLGEARPSGSDRHGIRSALVVAQVALALALLTGAGLLGKSLLRASRVDPGLEVENRIAVTVNLPPVRYKSGASVIQFWLQLLQRIQGLPGVINAAATSDRWLWAGRRTVMYDVAGDSEAMRRVPVAELRTVTPGYFKTLGIPIIEGRVFDDADRGAVDEPPEKQTPFVVVVSKTLVARQWPGESAIGKQIRPVVGNDQSYWSTIIGVVDDIRQTALTESPMPTVYLPEYQYAWRRLFLLVHTAGDPGSVVRGVQAAISDADPTLPSDDIVPLEQIRYQSLSFERSVTFFLMAFAVLAVSLAAVGVYGVIAYSVACRTQEYGVRCALGASRTDILRLVLGRGMGLALAGIMIGVALALVLSASLRSVLFETSPADPVTYTAVAAFLLLMSLAASLVPAWRAARVNPASALRAE